MTYEERYCAYVDILGFVGFIDELNVGSISYEHLKDVLNNVHAPVESPFSSFEDSDLKAQSISDAVCLSCSCTARGLDHLFYSLESLALSLLAKGFFIRGAIVKGKLYHDDRMVFGEALVRAFRLESTVARFPRIMISRDVEADARDYETSTKFKGELTDRIKQADDGPYYLHVLNIMNLILKGKEKHARPVIVERYNDFAAQIQRRFEASVDNPRHFEKVQWFARYWNDVVMSHSHEVRLIMGPGLGILHQPMDEA